MPGSRRTSWGVLIGFLAGITILAPSVSSFAPADAAENSRKSSATKSTKSASKARASSKAKATAKRTSKSSKSGTRSASRRPLPPTTPGKDAAVIVDGVSGRVLYSRNADESRFPASLTKIMTLYVLFEALEQGSIRLDTQLVTSSYAAGVYPTKLGLKAGETISVDLAIKAVAVLSANDAAVVVAENLSGSESRFAERMTAKARAIGMTKSTFQNASGLPNPRQVTTATDMALLGRRVAYDFPQYYHYFAVPSFRYKNRVYNTHDHLLAQFSGTDGIKTGYTRASGFNLVSSVVRDDRHLVGVVMGGISVPSRDREMMRLLAEGFESATKNPSLVATANVPWRGGRPPFTNPFKPAAPTAVASANANRVTASLPAAAPAPTESVIAVDIVPVLPQTIVPPSDQPAQITLDVTPTQDLVQLSLLEQGDVAGPSLAETTESLKRWAIQIGAFASAPIAEAQLVAYARQAIDIFAFAERYVVPIQGNDGQTLYRARFGLFAEDEAQNICRQMMQVGQTCFAALQAE